MVVKIKVLIRLRQNTLQDCRSAAEIPFHRGCRNEWHNDLSKLKEIGRVGFGKFRFDTPQPACWSIAEIPFTGLRGASI